MQISAPKIRSNGFFLAPARSAPEDVPAQVDSYEGSAVFKSHGTRPSAAPAALTATSGQRLPGLDRVWQQGFRGQNQTVAIIDSGIFPHPDIKDRIVDWVDFEHHKPKPYDKYGHGTHVAGLVAGSGKKSDGKIKGVAPEAKLVGLRINSIDDAIEALDYVVAHKDRLGITVVNMSLGDKATRGAKDDRWAQATQRAIDAGLVVVVAAGDGKEPGGISTPGILPEAITVGAVDDRGTLDPKDDVRYEASGVGPTIDGVEKPDIAAPGANILAPAAPGAALDLNGQPKPFDAYMPLSGTSQATPMVSGLATLLKQANPNLKQQDIMRILKQSAYKYDNLGKQHVGAGMVQADKALELALKLNSGTSTRRVASVG